MTDEEKEKYRDGLIATCKVYCHIDYDDDMEILELMFDVTMQEMTELIPNFDQYSLTSRQKLLAFISVKELYDNRDKYRSDMTDEEKEKYRDGLIATCKVYCHIDYDDDMEILELMFDVTMQEMTELIPNFDQYSLTSRQKLLAFISVKELYDNRDKYRSDTKLLASAASSMLLKEIYGGAAQ